MATRAQKHAAAVAKRGAFLEEVRISGLREQEKDRKKREARQKQREEQARQEAFDKEEKLRNAKAAIAEAQKENA